MTDTFLRFKQFIDFNSRLTVTYSCSEDVKTYLSRMHSSLESILQILPDPSVNINFEIQNKQGKSETTQLKVCRLGYFVADKIVPMPYKF